MRLENCGFWGPSAQKILSHSRSYVSISNCYLSNGWKEHYPLIGAGQHALISSHWEERYRRGDPEKPMVEADNGKLQVIGCSFATGEPSVYLKDGLQHAIISGNNGVNGVRIINEIGEKAIIANNE